MCNRKLILFVLLMLGVSTAYSDTTPTLYSTTNYQSPTETQSNRIVTIPGYDIDVNASVYYEEISDTDIVPNHPDFLPTEQRNKKEFVKIISNHDAPYSLSVKFPASATQDKIYALWVKNRQGDWSKQVLLNDPKPQWIFPKRGYATQGFSTFGRRYFLAGRGLKLAADKQLPLSLKNNTTTTTYTVIPKIYQEKSADYLLYFDLPSSMEEGNYTVSLFNRPTTNKLIIIQDPQPKRRFDITDYGAIPNDNQDDTKAMKDAITAAVANGGGEIYFPEGRWEFSKEPKGGDTYGYDPVRGHLLVPNIDITGAGKDKTIIVKKPSWNIYGAFFTPKGNNIIKDVAFVEEVTNEADRKVFYAIQMGNMPAVQLKATDGLNVVTNVQITGCSFTNMQYAIYTYGLPISELYISDNLFYPYISSVYLMGDKNRKFPTYQSFFIKDGIIFNNTFLPGDYVGEYTSIGIPIQGPIASTLSGTVRFAILDNLIDGRGEYNGFRAGLFSNALDSSEQVLITHNDIHCSGDRAGDGEAIVFEANQNDTAFLGYSSVLEATSTTITPALALENNVTDYYKDYWVYILSGPGIGQVRKVIHNEAQPNTPVTIEPAWDVIPVAGESKFVVTTSYNWYYIVNNLVDNKNGCNKTSPKNKSGYISMSAINSDSVIVNNTQYETDGIGMGAHLGDDSLLFTTYNALIKGNIVDGKYNDQAYFGGIMIGYGKATAEREDSLHTYNIDIYNNTVNKASGGWGFGDQTGIYYFCGHWYPTGAKAFKNTIISENKVSNVDNGIGLTHASDWDDLYFNTIICDNRLENIAVEAIETFGIGTVRCDDLF